MTRDFPSGGERKTEGPTGDEPKAGQASKERKTKNPAVSRPQTLPQGARRKPPNEYAGYKPSGKPAPLPPLKSRPLSKQGHREGGDDGPPNTAPGGLHPKKGKTLSERLEIYIAEASLLESQKLSGLKRLSMLGSHVAMMEALCRQAERSNRMHALPASATASQYAARKLGLALPDKFGTQQRKKSSTRISACSDPPFGLQPSEKHIQIVKDAFLFVGAVDWLKQPLSGGWHFHLSSSGYVWFVHERFRIASSFHPDHIPILRLKEFGQACLRASSGAERVGLLVNASARVRERARRFLSDPDRSLRGGGWRRWMCFGSSVHDNEEFMKGGENRSISKEEIQLRRREVLRQRDSLVEALRRQISRLGVGGSDKSPATLITSNPMTPSPEPDHSKPQVMKFFSGLSLGGCSNYSGGTTSSPQFWFSKPEWEEVEETVLSRLFRVLDRSESGFIGFQEFSILLKCARGILPFKQSGEEGGGEGGEREREERFFASEEPTLLREIYKEFEEADCDNDGEISYADFVAWSDSSKSRVGIFFDVTQVQESDLMQAFAENRELEELQNLILMHANELRSSFSPFNRRESPRRVCPPPPPPQAPAEVTVEEDRPISREAPFFLRKVSESLKTENQGDFGLRGTRAEDVKEMYGVQEEEGEREQPGEKEKKEGKEVEDSPKLNDEDVTSKWCHALLHSFLPSSDPSQGINEKAFAGFALVPRSIESVCSHDGEERGREGGVESLASCVVEDVVRRSSCLVEEKEKEAEERDKGGETEEKEGEEKEEEKKEVEEKTEEKKEEDNKEDMNIEKDERQGGEEGDKHSGTADNPQRAATYTNLQSEVATLHPPVRHEERRVSVAFVETPSVVFISSPLAKRKADGEEGKKD